MLIDINKWSKTQHFVGCDGMNMECMYSYAKTMNYRSARILTR